MITSMPAITGQHLAVLHGVEFDHGESLRQSLAILLRIEMDNENLRRHLTSRDLRRA
jgi:hypothetical protein